MEKLQQVYKGTEPETSDLSLHTGHNFCIDNAIFMAVENCAKYFYSSSRFCLYE